MESLGFEQCLADTCVFRLVKNGKVSIMAVVHADVQLECDQLCQELNELVPISNLGDLTWYGGCHHSRDKERGLLTISEQISIERLVEKHGSGSRMCNPASPGVKLDKFDPEKSEGDLAFS